MIWERLCTNHIFILILRFQTYLVSLSLYKEKQTVFEFASWQRCDTAREDPRKFNTGTLSPFIFVNNTIVCESGCHLHWLILICNQDLTINNFTCVIIKIFDILQNLHKEKKVIRSVRTCPGGSIDVFTEIKKEEPNINKYLNMYFNKQVLFGTFRY